MRFPSRAANVTANPLGPATRRAKSASPTAVRSTFSEVAAMVTLLSDPRDLVPTIRQASCGPSMC